MKKMLATFLYRLAQWFDPKLNPTQYNRKEYGAIARDVARLKAVQDWVADPLLASQYREALIKQTNVKNWEYFPTSPETGEIPSLKASKEIYKPLEPFENQEFQALNSAFEKLRYLLNLGRDNAERHEELCQDFNRELIRLLDPIERAARGDLTIYIEPDINVFPSLGVIGDVFNIILTNFREDIRSLPEEHPLRKKYKI